MAANPIRTGVIIGGNTRTERPGPGGIEPSRNAPLFVRRDPIYRVFAGQLHECGHYEQERVDRDRSISSSEFVDNGLGSGTDDR